MDNKTIKLSYTNKSVNSTFWVRKMNKRLKVVLFVLLGIASFIGLVIGGYFLLNSAYSATIYNVQIVDENGNPMNNLTRNLVSSDTNFVKLDVNIKASDSQQVALFSSSNPDVAKVIRQDDGYVLKYYTAGSATITAYSQLMPEVRDSFVITVNQNFIDNIVIADYADNHFSVFADGVTHPYPYCAVGADGEKEDANNAIFDSMLLRVVDNYDKSVFSSIKINQIDKTVEIKTNIVVADSTQVFYLQAYYVDDQQNEHVIKNFAYYVDVVGKKIVDIQLLICKDYNFDSSKPGYIYLSIDDEHFDYKKTNEIIMNDVVFSSGVSDLYFKIRLIYSNHTSADVSAGEVGVDSTEDVNDKCLTFTGSEALGMDCWLLTFKLPTTDYSSQGQIEREFKIGYSQNLAEGQNTSIEKTFKVTYKFDKDIIEEGKTVNYYQDFVNQNLYASVVKESDLDTVLYYEYIYWDNRYLDRNNVVIQDGKIVKFLKNDYSSTLQYKMVIDNSGAFLYYIDKNKDGKVYDKDFKEYEIVKDGLDKTLYYTKDGEYFDKNFKQIENPNN